MRRKRASLPAADLRAGVLRAISESQVVIVEGETGSGKTTQVPQFILEEAAESGAHCHIICTQPRRLSAIGVAERVASERCERLGATVGYRIRLEVWGRSRLPRHPRAALSPPSATPTLFAAA